MARFCSFNGLLRLGVLRWRIRCRVLRRRSFNDDSSASVSFGNAARIPVGAGNEAGARLRHRVFRLDVGARSLPLRVKGAVRGTRTKAARVRTQQVARTGRHCEWRVRVFCLAIIPSALYSIEASKLRRPSLSDRYFFIAVRPLRRREKRSSTFTLTR
jgi:hypothetical protein